MTKDEIVKKISYNTGVDAGRARVVIEEFMDVVKRGVSNGETVFLRGFGTFAPKKRAEKLARDIKNNSKIMVPARTVPAFKPAKCFKDMLGALD